MTNSVSIVALDVGEKRIGVATADTSIKIAVPYDTIEVDGTEIAQISSIIDRESANRIVVGYPRNQSGEPTAQTAYVEAFADKLSSIGVAVVFQDESVTSVQAENQLKAHNRPYTKGDIDRIAASIILQDYLEYTYGRV